MKTTSDLCKILAASLGLELDLVLDHAKHLREDGDRLPIDEWMEHERARQVRREKATREAKVPRDGEIDIDARTRAAHRTSGF